MDSEKFLLTAVAATISICVIAAVISSAIQAQGRRAAAIEMVKAGADPLSAACLVGEGTERFCELYVVTLGIRK